MKKYHILKISTLPIFLSLFIAGTSCQSTQSTEQQSIPAQNTSKSINNPNLDAQKLVQKYYQDKVDYFYQRSLELSPAFAIELGYHQFDGQIESITPEAQKNKLQFLKEQISIFEAFQHKSLNTVQLVEQEVILSTLKNALFDMIERKMYQKNPIHYGLSLAEYISRPYASLEKRAKAIIKVAKQSEAYFLQAQKNLEDILPLSLVQIALAQSRGNAEFIRGDVKLAMQKLPETQKTELFLKLDQMATVLDAHVKYLEEREKQADQNFALGKKNFMKMLKIQNNLNIDLKTLKEVAEKDLERNLKLMKEAANKINPKASIMQVVQGVLDDKPDADKVLQEATMQLENLKKHIIEHKIVSIPEGGSIKVTETPLFMRYNFAFLDGAGLFETKKLPSFYYITPPDSSWDKATQRAYIPGKNDLLGTSIHEVWPGHFLHSLHKKQVKSKILKSFWNYAMGEGWAHYSEEMMVQEGGYHTDDPKVQVGLLINALLRNVRFITAIGLHCEGMSIATAEQLFKDKAFQDPANASQQANRGTFDPMFLSYTLGKLMIKKLKVDYKLLKGDSYSEQMFHDEFLSYGAAPVPAIRRAILGSHAGSAL